MLAGSRELNLFEQLDQPEDRFIEIVITGRHRLSFRIGATFGLRPRSSGVESHPLPPTPPERTLPVDSQNR